MILEIGCLYPQSLIDETYSDRNTRNLVVVCHRFVTESEV